MVFAAMHRRHCDLRAAWIVGVAARRTTTRVKIKEARVATGSGIGIAGPSPARVYGALVGLGVYILAKFDLWFVIGNVNVPATSANMCRRRRPGYFLIALIYGVPWIITAQLSAEMVFVGLTNWQPHSDADREWFGRSTGYFTVVALMWFAITFLVLIAAEILWSFVRRTMSREVPGALTAAGSGLFSTLMGKSGKSSATDQKDKSGRMMRIAVPLGAIVFVTILVLTISLSARLSVVRQRPRSTVRCSVR